MAEGAAESKPLDGDEALRWLEGLAAAQGANPDELLTAPEERPAETPAWIVAEQAAAPVEAAEEAVAQPTPLDEMPDWLREAMPAQAVNVEPEVELPPPSLAELAAPAPADVDDTGPSRVTSWPAAEPEPVARETTAEAAAEQAELDGDEALRWLEGLAAAQGANPEELLTKPEERPAETPAWIVAEQTDLTSAEAALTGEPGDLQTEPMAGEPTRPDWLPAEPREPVTALAAEDSAAELPAEAAAEATELDGDEALRWLEGLAAAQGANADELLTKPEDRLSEAPAWAAAEATGVDTAVTELAASAEAEAALEPEPMVEPEPVEAITPPTWVAGEVAADAGEAAAPEPADETTDETPAEHTPTTGTADLSKLSRLSERLANARRARETEIEARFAEQRAQQEAARREVEQRMAAWRDAMEAEEATPATASEPEPPAPAPTPEPEPVAVPVSAPASAPYVRPHTPPAAAPRVPAELPDFAAALARLTPQVQAGADLAHTIHELEGLATAEQAPAPVLRLLGDAYVRADRLPRALEAYREALSRL